MNFLEKYNVIMKDVSLLETALTHTSFSNENKNVENYERMEFLGDAIIQMVVSEYFYKDNTLSEGEMTKKRAAYVCENALNFYAEKINVLPHVRVGHGQLNKVNKTILADIFEAVVGAIYLDQGLDKVRNFIYEVVIPEIKDENHFFDDYKTLLQELVQTTKKSVTYNIISEEGEAHNKEFTISVSIGNMVYGTGKGRSKKEAEQNAAQDAYEKSVK